MNNTKNIVMASVFAALICVLTIFPKFPVPLGGYIHLGDALIIASVFFIGKYSVASAAAGSALADILSGYFLPYSPATFVIKGLMALAAYLVYKTKKSNASFILSALVSEIIMVAGYYIFEIFLYGIAGASLSLAYNFIQAGGGFVLGIVFYFVLKRINFKKYL